MWATTAGFSADRRGGPRRTSTSSTRRAEKPILVSPLLGGLSVAIGWRVVVLVRCSLLRTVDPDSEPQAEIISDLCETLPVVSTCKRILGGQQRRVGLLCDVFGHEHVLQGACKARKRMICLDPPNTWKYMAATNASHITCLAAALRS